MCLDVWYEHIPDCDSRRNGETEEGVEESKQTRFTCDQTTTYDLNHEFALCDSDDACNN